MRGTGADLNTNIAAKATYGQNFCDFRVEESHLPCMPFRFRHHTFVLYYVQSKIGHIQSLITHPNA